METPQAIFTTQQADPVETGWAAYDAVPRDGPAVFVVDVHELDQGRIAGAWIDPDTRPAVAAFILSQRLGRDLAPNDLAVIDQTGLSDEMSDEDYFAARDCREVRS